jgi:hypothetical protein
MVAGSNQILGFMANSLSLLKPDVVLPRLPFLGFVESGFVGI